MRQDTRTWGTIAVSILIIAAAWAGAAAAVADSTAGDATAAQETTTTTATETTRAATGTEAAEVQTTVGEPTEATTAAATAGQAGGSAAFENNTVAEQRGDVAEFTVTLDGTDRARVTIGSPAVNYVASFTVVDANGDGRVTVDYNTFLAGLDTSASGITAGEGDEIRNYELRTEPLDSPLEAGGYEMSVSVGGEETDVATLDLGERSTGQARTWIAPADADADTAAEIRSVATQNDTVAQGDLAIVQVEASGLYGYLQDAENLSAGENGLSFTVTETNPGPNEAPENVSLENATLVTDPANDQFFVLIDTSAVEANSTYAATFSINDSNPLLAAGEVQNASTTFTVLPRQVAFDDVTEDGLVQIRSTDGNGTLSGTATLAPGSEFTIEVRNTGASPFLDRQTVTVGPNGTWNATFDLGNAPAGEEFEITVEELNVTRTGVIVGGGAAQTTTAAAETTAAATETTQTETTQAETTTAAETTEA